MNQELLYYIIKMEKELKSKYHIDINETIKSKCIISNIKY